MKIVIEDNGVTAKITCEETNWSVVQLSRKAQAVAERYAEECGEEAEIEVIEKDLEIELVDERPVREPEPPAVNEPVEEVAEKDPFDGTGYLSDVATD